MISYSINNTEHRITFCKTKKLEKISDSIENVKSDKNVLLIYDNKILKNSKFGDFSKFVKFFLLPTDKLSTVTTWCPSDKSNSAK